MKSFGSLFIYVIGALVCTLTVEAQIRGTPGVDYPNYVEIPKTSFKCSEQKYIPGFYADVETQCQVFHFCFDNRHESFLCPTGTVFNQKFLGCDSWYSSNCSLAPLFYSVNSGSNVESARKGMSMLLQMRNWSRDNTQTSTANILEHISSLYDASTEQEPISDLNTDNAVSESASDEEKKGEPELENVKKEANVSEVLGKMIAGFEKIKEKAEEDASSESSENVNADVNEDEGFYSHMNKGFVYDPQTQQYYMTDYDPSEINWEDESARSNEENRNFYGDYDIILHGENQPANIFGNYMDEQDDEREYSNVPEDMAFEDQNAFYMDEFSKRMLQTRQQTRNTRRKPVYVVLDDTEDMDSEPEQKQNSIIADPTESPYFTESISIDDLISGLNTEVPLSREAADNFETFDPYQQVSEENEKEAEEIIVESPDIKEFSDGSHVWKSEAQPVPEYGSQTSNFPQEGESEENQDFISFEDDGLADLEKSEEVIDEKIQGEDPSTYLDGNASEESSYYDVLGTSADEDSDDIQIIQDSAQDVPEGVMDETGYDSVDYPQEWTYMYADPRENLESDSYEVDASSQDFEGEETSYYDPYAEYMDQSYVHYSPDSMESQDLPQDYDYVETNEEVLPQGYQFMQSSENENLHSYGVPGTYQVSEAVDQQHPALDLPTAEDSAANEYYPDAASMEQASTGSYEYRYLQPGEQQVYNMNGYPYNHQFDYTYDRNGMQYSYDSNFASLGEPSESRETLNEEVEEQPGTTSELEADGTGVLESSSVSSIENAETEDLGLDYVEEVTEEIGLDRLAEVPDEEIIYVLDTDDVEKQEQVDELSYGESSYSDYTQDAILDEAEYILKLAQSASAASDSNLMQNTQLSKSINESRTDAISASSKPFIAPKDKESSSDPSANVDVSAEDIFHSKNAEQIMGSWPYDAVVNKENMKPALRSQMQEHRVERFEPAEGQSFGDFVAPGEMLMNNMAFSNPMGFNPYGYGNANLGQFSMMDSSNTAGFTKKNGGLGNGKENADQTRLSKLSSLKDKVMSMKRGKFGMFKKSLKTL